MMPNSKTILVRIALITMILLMNPVQPLAGRGIGGGFGGRGGGGRGGGYSSGNRPLIIGSGHDKNDQYYNSCDGHCHRIILITVTFSIILVLLIVFCIFRIYTCWKQYWALLKHRQYRVVVLQIALSGSARSIRQEIDKLLARTTNHSTYPTKLFTFYLTLSTLLNNPSSLWISGRLYVGKYRTVKGMKDKVRELSDELRPKEEDFDVESQAKVEDEELCKEEEEEEEEVVVVTIIAGVTEFIDDLHGNVIDRESMKRGLQRLNWYPYIADADCAEVFWSPRNENDAFSLEDLRLNYPRFQVFT